MTEGQIFYSILAVCGAVLAIAEVKVAFKTGSIRLGDKTLGLNIRRENQPAVFWGFIIAFALGAAALIAAVLLVWAMRKT